MASILLPLVLGLAVVTAWLAWSLSRQRHNHEKELQRLEARWTEKMRLVEGVLAEKATMEDAKNLASMIDGVATAGIRIERRVTCLEEAANASPPSPENP